MTLSTRLSLFFLGTMALLLVGFSVALYATAAKYLHRQADERLEAALNTLVAAAEINAEGVEWEPEERRLSFGRRMIEGQLLWVICDDRGRRIDGSDPGPGPLTSSSMLSPSRGRPRPLVDPQGRPWKIMVRRLASSPAPGTGGPRAAPAPETERARQYDSLLIGAAVSLTGVHEELTDLGFLLVALSAGTWLLALVVGGRLSRRALRPVAAMAGAARAIRGDEPGSRLPEVRSGDELEDLGRAFNGLLDRLHESHERQRRFTGDASHQLRTPLTALQGQVDLALRQERSGEEYRRVLTLAQRKIRHLGQIVEALLFLARADAESQRPQLEPIELSGWLRDRLKTRTGPRRDDVRLESGSGGPDWVRAHSTLLGELLDNLLDNACKYSESGTPVIVRTSRDGEWVRVGVEDRGIGIAGGEVSRLTDPFYRTDPARRRDARGLGLGLSVAARIAEVFGGRLEVESRPGQGSTFTVVLPVASPPGPSSTATPEAGPADVGVGAS